MNHWVFLLEERSAQELLQGLLPRILPEDAVVRYIVFEGKQDLEQQIIRRLRGYQVPQASFVVLRDKDAADCQVVKEKLVKMCYLAGCPQALVRIACHELESWYLADLAAVERGLGIPGLSSKQMKAKYSDPDAIANASEELRKLTGNRYQKIMGSRAIGAHLVVENDRSRSFRTFIHGLQRLINQAKTPTYG